MSEEQTKALKLELAFDEATAKVLTEMRDKARVGSNERLILNALRVYDWYLAQPAGSLYAKRGEQWAKIELEL